MHLPHSRTRIGREEIWSQTLLELELGVWIYHPAKRGNYTKKKTYLWKGDQAVFRKRGNEHYVATPDNVSHNGGPHLVPLLKHFQNLYEHTVYSSIVNATVIISLKIISFTIKTLERFSSQDRRFVTSLVVQWLRICLPMQGTWVWALVWEDPTCCRATKPVCHKYWAYALEPASHNYWACVPWLLKPMHLEPVLCNKISHHKEKPAHCNKE